jgi:hypothetical protein
LDLAGFLAATRLADAGMDWFAAGRKAAAP